MTELRRSKTGVLQKRELRPGDFGKAKRTRFLDALAMTCNVEAAARAAGVTAITAQRTRRRDGEFARLWAAAIDDGQERLREEVLARALGQVDTGDNPDERRTPAPDVPFDMALALKILAIQAREAPNGARRSARGKVPTKEAVFAALAKRLDEMDRAVARRAASAAGAQEGAAVPDAA